MISKSFDTRSKNIDLIMDMINSAKRENGIEPTMEEALFDPVTKQRINKFKKEQLKEEGVDLSKYGTSTKPSCGNCKKCDNGEKTVSNIDRGIFVYSEDDLYDDSDELYVCEYCTKINYDNAYRPDKCDVCEDCDGCTEYLSGECDGCGYSFTYNGGQSYSEANSDVEVSMIEEDEQLMEDVDSDEPEYERLSPVKGFSIMDY